MKVSVITTKSSMHLFSFRDLLFSARQEKRKEECGLGHTMRSRCCWYSFSELLLYCRSRHGEWSNSGYEKPFTTFTILHYICSLTNINTSCSSQPRNAPLQRVPHSLADRILKNQNQTEKSYLVWFGLACYSTMHLYSKRNYLLSHIVI